MAYFDNYNAFESTTESSEIKTIGCANPILLTIVILIFVLYLIGKLFS